MQSFKNFITELFDDSYDWKVIKNKKGEFEAEFSTEGFDYRVQISYIMDTANIIFSAKGSDDDSYSTHTITKEMKASKVLSTIARIIGYNVNKFQPEKMKFSADKEEIGRASVYQKMLDRLLPDEYVVKIEYVGADVLFIITKDNSD